VTVLDDDSRTFTRNGRRYTINGAKASNVWRESDHPRDRLGRFIETGAEVRMWGGQGGTVVRNVGGGRIEVERTDGSHVIIHRNYLTVTARPDGTAPTSDREAGVGELRETEPTETAVEAPEPTAVPDADAVTPGQGVDDALSGVDPRLAERVRSAASDYQEALYNDAPDDEADERAALIAALDEVDANHGSRPDVAEQSRLLRQAAEIEPAGAPAGGDTDQPPQGAQRPAQPRPAATGATGGPPTAEDYRNRPDAASMTPAERDAELRRVEADLENWGAEHDARREIAEAEGRDPNTERPDPAHEAAMDRAHDLETAQREAAEQPVQSAPEQPEDDDEPVTVVEGRRSDEGPPVTPPADEPEPEPVDEAARLEDARERLSAYSTERLRDTSAGYSARRAAQRADTIAMQGDTHLRLSPSGGVIAQRTPDDRWFPHAVGNAAELTQYGHPGFDADQIDAVLARLDDLGIPFGDTAALRARWSDVDQKAADTPRIRAIVTDPAYQPVPTEGEMMREFRLAVHETMPPRRNARPRPGFETLVRARDLFGRARDTDNDAITAILRDEDIGDTPQAQRLLAMWGRYTGDPSLGAESREERVARQERQGREQAQMDDRWAVSGSGLYSTTLTNLRAGDVIYTRGQGTEASPVELPRTPRTGTLPRVQRIPRTVDRIEGSGNNRTIHFTDGTSTGAEGGDRTGATYSGRARVFGVPAPERPEPGAPTPVVRPPLITNDGDDPAEVRANMLALFNYTHTNGWKTRLRVQRVGRSGSTVRGDILDETGRAVGVVQRSVYRNAAGQLEVHHDLLSINPAYQGGGFADAYYKHLYAGYEAHGIDVVTINANIDVGGYAWAQRGFNWNGGEVSPYQRSAMQANIDRLLAGRGASGTPVDISHLSEDQMARLRQFREDIGTRSDWSAHEVANALSDITWTETTRGGKEITVWPGKRALLGTSWHGTYQVGTTVQGRQRGAEQPAQPPEQPETPVGGVITPGDWMNARAGRGAAQRADWYTITYDDPDAEYTPSPPTGVFEVRNVQPSPGTDGYRVMLVGADGGRREIEVPADAQLTPADPPGEDAAVPDNLPDLDDQALQNELDRLYDIRGQLAGNDPAVPRLQRGIDAIEAERQRRTDQPDQPETPAPVQPGEGNVPTAVMVTPGGQVWARGEDRTLFTPETAQAFADRINANLRPGVPRYQTAIVGAPDEVEAGQRVIVLDPTTGQVYDVDPIGGAFTPDTARAFADRSNANLRPGVARYQVHGLTEPTDQPEQPGGAEQTVGGHYRVGQTVEVQVTDFSTRGRPRVWRRGTVERITQGAGGLSDVFVVGEDGERLPTQIVGRRGGNQRIRPAAEPETPTARPGRFGTDLDAVREHLRSIDRDLGREGRERLADDPMAVLSDGGRWIIHRNPNQGEEQDWRISAVGNGVRLPGAMGTREEALAIANHIEAARDINGDPFPADGDDVQTQVGRWADDQGNRLRDLWTNARADVARTSRRDEDWNDDWARSINTPDDEDEDEDFVDLPDDLTHLTDAELEELEAEAHTLDDTAALGRINDEVDRRAAAAEEARNARDVDVTTALLPGEASDQTVEDNVRAMFGYEHPESGWSTSFGVWVRGDRSTIRGSIVDRDGNQVGSVERSVYMNGRGELEVHHDYLHIDPAHQGQGFADAYYKHLYAQYEAFGVDVVSINANIDVGGYAWAQRGFEWDGGEASYYVRSTMIENLEAVLRGRDNDGRPVPGLSLTGEQQDRVRRFIQDLRDNPAMSPKQVANALSDIEWTETTRGGKQIRMWPGKRALLGTNWNGTYHLRAGDQTVERPARPQQEITVPDADVEWMSDAALVDEGTSNVDLLTRLTNVQMRGNDDPLVQGFVERQREIHAERQRRVAVASQRLIPDGEDVEYTELREGDTVVVPFVSEDGPQLARIGAVVPGPMDRVVLMLDDGTRRVYTIVGNMAQARWRRGRVPPVVEQVRGTDLAESDRVVLDDGRTGTITAIAEVGDDRLEVDVDVDGAVEAFDVDRDSAWARITDATEVPQPDPGDLSDEELAAEQMRALERLRQDRTDQAARARWDALSDESRRRREAAEQAARETPVVVGATDEATARPRLYTYQRRNLVALGLDHAGSDAPPEVQQAAARVRNRMPVTAAQADALAQHLRTLSEDESRRIVQRRSLARLAAAFDTASVVAQGRAAGAETPVNTDVRRVRTTGLTSGDTAVIRSRTGVLQTVRVRDVKPMMRGTLARITVEHDDGTIEERLVDRDTDAWLMPDLPADKPVAPAPQQVREIVFAEDIRPGDRILYDRLDGPGAGERVDGVVGSVTDRHGDTYVTVDGYEFEVRPTQLRTRLERGDNSADQPYWLTVTDEANPPTITGGEIRVGDLIEDDGLTNMSGTVVDVEDIEGEGGVRGWRFQVADTDRGYINSFTMFDPQVVTRRASAGENAVANVAALSAEHHVRQRLGGALSALEEVQVERLGRIVTAALVDERLSRVGGRPSTLTRDGVLAEMGRTALRERRTLTDSGDAAYRMSVALGGYRESGARRGEANRIVEQAFDDAYDRLTASVRDAQPLPGEDEAAMVRRVLEQWRETPPRRHNEQVARSLIRGSEGLTAEPEQVTPADLPALDGADLGARIGVYRQMIGTTFGHTTTRHASFGDLDFDALERGEVPAITFTERTQRDMDAADNGPGATAMRHLDTVRAAGADVDAAIREREAALAAARLRSTAGELYRDGDTVDTLRTRMAQEQERLSGERDAAFQAFKDAEAAFLRSHGFESIAHLHNRRHELAAAIRRDGLTADREELARLDDLWEVLQSREQPSLAAALDTFYQARQAHQDLLARIEGLSTAANTIRREAARDVLAGIRDIGGQRLGYQAADATRGRGRYTAPGRGRPLTDRDQNVRAMRSAEDVLPADWVRAIGEHLRTAYNRERMGVGSLTRGHADYRGNIRLSDSGSPRFDGDNGRGRVAVHELGHWAERAVPGLIAAEAAFLWSRTSSGEVGSRQREQMVNMRGRGGDRTQYGFLDEFAQAYSGVDYARSQGRSSEAYELLTTGLESLFAGSEYMDEDYRRWLLGVLALL
jgi:ribosomal protein S18 acetylase RimI-like enzyme